MGDNFFHGFGKAFDRLYPGKRISLTGIVQPIEKYDKTSAFIQWLGSCKESPYDLKKTMPAYGMCIKMEQPGTFLGLSLPRFQIQ